MANANQSDNKISSEDFSDVLDERFGEVGTLLPESKEKEYDIMDKMIMEDVFDVAKEEIEKQSKKDKSKKIEQKVKSVGNQHTKKNTDDKRVKPETSHQNPSSKNKEEFNLLVTKNAEALEKTETTIKSLNAQINKLADDNIDLKEQITALISSANRHYAALDNQDSIEALQKEQKLILDTLKDKKKISVLVYTALTLAIISLIVIMGLAGTSYQTKSKVNELSQQVVTIEQKNSALATDHSKEDIEKLNRQVSFLTSARQQISTQLNNVNSALKDNTLTPVVDSLVKKNNLAQQAIKHLSQKVSSLEKRKFTVTPSLNPSKPAITSSTWIVNLVSSKQESFAISQAKEFNKKGIAAEVVSVKINDEDWFRLRVSGFNSRDKAASSAISIKEKLNLGSVWVTELK
jgi:outer membrane murein-binding lipoprotein Lpp